VGEGEEREGKTERHERTVEGHISREGGVRQAKLAVITPIARMLAAGPRGQR
jgi:hypothetical protein